jgi:CheY-like chemotaxis protein/two-component sensor histidine kinase
MASVGILAAGVAHEINNPLAAVIANLEIGGQDLRKLPEVAAAPSRVLEALDDARDAAARIRTIVRDLKLFSRNDEQRASAVDVAGVIKSTLRLCWNEVRHRARLVEDYGAVPRVLADEARLGQVIVNLVINAAHAIAEGDHDNNSIRVGTSVDPQGRVVITVADTGAGIPEAARDRVFTPFFTTKPAGVGTGLGLPICRRIIRSFGGEITFDTESGKGTQFRVVLPAASDDAPRPVPVAPPPRVAAARRGRVLVIDDDAMVATVVERALGEEHAVTTERDGRAALARFDAGERFDVVLCDLMMPQVTGMEVHAALSALDGDQASRVIFLTGGAFTPRARAFLDRVPNHRVEKPFGIQALRALVNGLVR